MRRKDFLGVREGLAFVVMLGLFAPAAVAQPPEKFENLQVLRQNSLLGLFRFDEWTMNEVARSLSAAGNTDAAIAMLELNGEFFPKSADIDFGLGELHRKRGERDKALARYKAALEKQPDYAPAKKQLEELMKSGG